MSGMNTQNGKPLTGINHLKQSITDILTTPIGSRVMRRDYGSRLYQLVDNPTTEDFAIDLYTATAEALELWEPRFKLEQVTLDKAKPGKVSLTLKGRYIPQGTPLLLDGIIIS